MKKFCYDYPRPAVTVDIVLFYAAKEGLEVLLVQRAKDPFKDHWALPGGFVDENEALAAAAVRELLEETQLRRAKFKQIGAFGDPGRDPRGHTVSIAFAAILKSKPIVTGADDAKAAAWHPVKGLPKLAFDHKKIIRAALQSMGLEG
ncbi:MAG: NUDIX hydrolase [Acidobacteria bacterium]|nr:NUDIX hydrolase [Acidobacteriota bacterium]